MLTKLVVRNFKRFEDVEIELGNPVVFIGPNNSGKSTALQALALWDLGARRWLEKRKGKAAPEKRPGVTINRRELLSVPVPEANLLWRDLHVRDVVRTGTGLRTHNVRIDIKVDGVTDGAEWTCGLEFDYANDESFYCRPLRVSEDPADGRMPVPPELTKVRVSFLPPMSGLADREFAKQEGEIGFLIGQGRTAEVLRNLCLQVARDDPGGPRSDWKDIQVQMEQLFGVSLDMPRYVPERAEITLSYREAKGPYLDVSASGRGLQQTLLLLAYLAANPGSVLLLDEPDAHLEILRQRQIYQLLSETAARQGSQIIAASHSEVLLNEAAGRDVVVAFVGNPHRIDDRGSQVRKALSGIGFEDYYEAEQTGLVLYLEGSTDWTVLRALARRLNHPVAETLEAPFVKHVQNQPTKARDHFYGLREAKPDLVGFALFDRLDQALQEGSGLVERMWRRREIENYICSVDALLAFAADAAFDVASRSRDPGPLFSYTPEPVRDLYRTAMRESIEDFAPPAALRDPDDRWWSDVKASDDFLDRVCESFFKRLDLQTLFRKSDYYRLAEYVPEGQIPGEVTEVLDDIARVAQQARPRGAGTP